MNNSISNNSIFSNQSNGTAAAQEHGALGRIGDTGENPTRKICPSIKNIRSFVSNNHLALIGGTIATAAVGESIEYFSTNGNSTHMAPVAAAVVLTGASIEVVAHCRSCQDPRDPLDLMEAGQLNQPEEN